MANKILPKRGTRAALTALQGSSSLTAYELLFVTDEGRLEMATSTSVSVAMAKLSDISLAGKTGAYSDLTGKPTITSGTVTSVAMTVPTGLSVANSPITVSGTLAITYQAGYQGYTSAEATKLSGIASGAQPGTVTSVQASVPTGFSVSGGPVTGSGTLAIVYAAGYQGYTTTEATKLAGIASGATANTGTVTSVGISAPTGLTAGSAVTTSGNISLSWSGGYQGYTTTEATKLSNAVVVNADATIGAAGYQGTEVNDGSKSGVTYTPSQSGSNFRLATNGGAFTLAAPSAATVSMVVRLVNSATAGAVTMSGFHNVVGDSFDTTNGSQFMIFLTSMSGLKLANVVKCV